MSVKPSIQVRKPIEIADSLREQAMAGIAALTEESSESGLSRLPEADAEGVLEFASELRRFAELLEASAVLATIENMVPACPNCGIDLIAFVRSGVIVKHDSLPNGHPAVNREYSRPIRYDSRD